MMFSPTVPSPLSYPNELIKIMGRDGRRKKGSKGRGRERGRGERPLDLDGRGEIKFRRLLKIHMAISNKLCTCYLAHIRVGVMIYRVMGCKYIYLRILTPLE